MAKSKRIPRILLALSDIALASILLLLAVVSSRPARNLVRSRVEHAINAKIVGTCKLAELDFALFGNLKIAGLRVVDASGDEVARLDSLKVSPSWSSLVRGRIVIDSIALDGLALHVVQYEDGTSNLKRLVKPSPPAPPETGKKKDRRIQVRALSIAGVQVRIDKPDGTRMALSDFGLDGSIDAVPTTRTALVSVPRIAGAFSLDKGDPLKLSVSNIRTGLAVDLKDGAGTVVLARTTTHVNVLQAGAGPRDIDVELAGLDLKIGPGELDATMGRLAAGALMLQAIEVRGHAKDGALVGDQDGKIVGLHVDADKLNALLQKNVLATDADLETRLSGPANQLGLVTTLTTGGGKLTLNGTIDPTVKDQPKYDLVLGATGIQTEKLLHADARKMPPIETDKLTLGLKGAGISKETANAGFTLTVGRTSVGKVVIDGAVVEGRVIPGEVIIDSLTAHAVGQQLGGSARLQTASKQLHAQVSLEGDVGGALRRLKQAGVALKTSLPEGMIVLRKGTLEATVDGRLDQGLDAVVTLKSLGVAGGTVNVRALANVVRKEPGADGKKFEAKSVDAEVSLQGIRLSEVARLRGKELKGIDGTVSGTVHVTGTPKEPDIRYALHVNAGATDRANAPKLSVSLDGTANKHDVVATLEAVKEDAGKRSQVAHAQVHLPVFLEGGQKGLSPGRPMSVKLDIPRQSLLSLAALAPAHLLVGKKIPAADLEAHVDLGGTPAHPQGRVELEVAGMLAPQKSQRAHVLATLTPRDNATAVKADADVWLDAQAPAAVHAHVDADLSRSPLVAGPREVDWKATVDVAPQSLAALPLAPGKLDGMKGNAELHANLHGNLRDVLGDVHVQVQDFVRGKEMEPVTAKVDVKLEDKEATLDIGARIRGEEYLRVSGTAGVAGSGLIATLKKHQLADAALNLTLEIPRRPLSDLSAIRPALLVAPGQVEGKIAVTGTIGKPIAIGAVQLDEFETLDGHKGRAAVGLNAGVEELRASVDLGMAAGTGPAPVHIGIVVPREALAPYSAKEGNLPIGLVVQAAHVDVRSLVPLMVLKGKKMEVGGELDWNMKGGVELQKTDAGAKLVHGAVAGRLDVLHGRVTLPGTHRELRDVELRIASDASSMRIESLSVRESDLQNPNRTLRVDGTLAWDELRPRLVDAHLKASDWLVFGGGEIGPMDAPRASLSLDADVHAELGQAIKPVEMKVNSLELLLPDRFPKAHQAEETHLGDVMFVGDKGVVVGKLPVPEPAPAKPQEETPAPASGELAGYDIHIKIPNRVHILKDPMDLIARGQIDVTIRGGTRTIVGELKPEGGFLSLGGKQHAYDSGSIKFDKEHPKGWMDLHFKRVVPNPGIRDIAIASRGDAVKIGMAGLIGQQVTTLDGAGSPGTLFDLLSMHNVGRVRYLSGPAMPATQTVEYPQHDNLLMISFLSANLPHMLFLDRLAAWADPYERRDSYGRVQHLEAERYSSDGTTRVRAVSRARGAGQSQAEMQIDWLWGNTQRSVYGVGVTAGSRLGGGPGIFYEWSGN
ncbi:MAG: translocation/assembly module TamB domain-containing protein [Deltaproteobacteria bacterium]|nr:translocation/assembly module TamB domain-containing protein [Deltaproteobacteria bacterium]